MSLTKPKEKCTNCGDKVDYELRACYNMECNEELCNDCIIEKIGGDYCCKCCGEYEPYRRNIRDYIDE